MTIKLTKEQAKSVVQSAQLFNDHTTEENLAEYRREIQRRLDFVINNFFGPEKDRMTEAVLSDDISLYTGKPGEKGAPLFGISAMCLDEKIKSDLNLQKLYALLKVIKSINDIPCNFSCFTSPGRPCFDTSIESSELHCQVQFPAGKGLRDEMLKNFLKERGLEPKITIGNDGTLIGANAFCLNDKQYANLTFSF